MITNGTAACNRKIHVCGEESAIDVVKELLEPIGEPVEVFHYKRLTPLRLADSALCGLEFVKPGDAIVCFKKADIFAHSRAIQSLGIDTAIIYGGLPPSAKLAQAKRFNDPEDPCTVLVATDAIGMGLNLSIGRVIFSSLAKRELSEDGQRVFTLLTPSQTRQIGGRAGRYLSVYETGEVTTLEPTDFPKLRKLFMEPGEPIKRVGIFPTFEMIQLFAYHLPNETLASLLNIFETTCTVNEEQYFLCNMDDIKFFAKLLQDIPLPLRTLYIFCLAPVDQQKAFVCAMLMKFARRVSKGESISIGWLTEELGWPFGTPRSVMELSRLEETFDVLDIYLWLGYRIEQYFPDMAVVRDLQSELDIVIEDGVRRITALMESKKQRVDLEADQLRQNSENKGAGAKLNARKKQALLDQSLKASGTSVESRSSKRFVVKQHRSRIKSSS